MSDVSRTEIVLAVVERNGRICLARRSEQVATGRGLWSVVTGYLEAGISSLEQASQELLKEFGLASPDVRLVRALPPVPLSSPVSGKHFLVHPFLFESSVDCEVVLNWEHTDFAWVEPARLGDGDCVSWQHDIVLALLSQHPVENRHLVFTRNARQSPSPWRVSMSGEPGHATGPVESTLETPKGRTRSPPRTRQG